MLFRSVGMVLASPYAIPWFSDLMPPSAPNLAHVGDVPVPGAELTRNWETASGPPTGPDIAERPSVPAANAGRDADVTGGRSEGPEARVALTPPPKTPTPGVSPDSPALALAPPPKKPATAAPVSGGSGRTAERTASEDVNAPLVGDFAEAIRKALREHRGPSTVLGQFDNAAYPGVTAAGEIVSLVQQQLRERGYDPGSIDGRAGPRTRAAIRAFQRANDQEEDGEISVDLLQHLGILGQQIHAFGNGRPTATP